MVKKHTKLLGDDLDEKENVYYACSVGTHNSNA